MNVADQEREVFVNIVMSALEHSVAPLSLREKLSFTKQQTAEMVRRVRSFPHISGCVLISTCNHTELYLSCCGEQNPGELLCRAAGTEYAPYQDAFVTLAGHKAAEHLMEVAAGLRSRIFGEDQIISQVRNAVALAREAGTTDPVLETLFCCAVSAGKEVRTKVKLNALPTSAASMAVDLLEKKLGDLKGKKALVIGNGEMGRLSASLLQQKGCLVSVTLRTYRHGQTIVPPGCGVVPYEDRFLQMDGCDILLSATTSPHYTVTVEQLHGVSRLPAVMVDLAIPRDIQPEAGQLDGVALYNVDDLGSRLENRTVPPRSGRYFTGPDGEFLPLAELQGLHDLSGKPERGHRRPIAHRERAAGRTERGGDHRAFGEQDGGSAGDRSGGAHHLRQPHPL